MYRIRVDGKTVWHSGANNVKVLDPILEEGANRVSSLTFTALPKDSTEYSPMKSDVEVYYNREVLMRGRIFDVSEDFHNLREVACEGALGYLNDSIVRPYEWHSSLHGYFLWLIEQHNAQVEPKQRFKVGLINIEQDEHIYRSSTMLPSTWSEISEKLLDNVGGYLIVRYEPDGNYLDWLKDYPERKTQPIRFGYNLLDLVKQTESASFYNCLIPYGCLLEPEKEEGAEPEEETEPEPERRLDITSINGGVDYVMNTESVLRYGVKVYRSVVWDEVKTPETLLRRAKAEVELYCNVPEETTISAIDMNLKDNEISRFRIGDKITTKSKPHHVDVVIMLRDAKIALANPVESEFTFGFRLAKISNYSSNTEYGSTGVGSDISMLQDEIDRLHDLIENGGGTGGTGGGGWTPSVPDDEPFDMEWDKEAETFRIHNVDVTNITKNGKTLELDANLVKTK